MVAKSSQVEETPLDRALSNLHKVPVKVFDPLYSDVALYLFEEKDVMSAGGIYIPNAENWANKIGMVIAKGPFCETVEVNDIVLIKEVILTDHAKQPVPVPMLQVRYNNQLYHLVDETLIAGILYRKGNK